ncbi:hypothetical protein [Vreelandella arcis]|uniref:Bacteriophage lambda head decoration protein D n=1 Tax=Vreelandella arcis TaxID=416873 RepID=A0A1H0J0P4_9GAMM|nr:hypothetical protein [Halomonas arcis]SDO36931.1 hypothetical protein SAMN04487951_1237 [Halomonas arcis]
MTKINTVSAKGDSFLVHSDDYDVMFDALNVTVSGVAGDVLETSDAKVTDTSAEVLGILAEDTDGSQGNVRVMVRGNPTTVDAQKLNYNTSVAADIDALLEEKGIVAVNK